MKNILIYVHTSKFNFEEGGTVVQYLLAKTLEEYGQNVRIYSEIKIDNPIFSKYYENDFPIDNNAVVIYCEGVAGNPLNAKNVVRWMLSKLGQNVSYNYLNYWNKNELVYYFNSEEKIANNPDKLGSLFKMLTVIYVNPDAMNYFLPRKGICFTIRKQHLIHKKPIKNIHPPNAFEITRKHTQQDYITIFNQYECFISYDSITFLVGISALCGCITVVVPVDGLSKADWLNTLAAADYLKETGETALYGIAYGVDDLQYSINTLHLVREQWNKIVQYNTNKYIPTFINDINNFENNINTLEANFY